MQSAPPSHVMVAGPLSSGTIHGNNVFIAEPQMTSKSIRQHCSGVELTSNVMVSHFQFAVVTNDGILRPRCTCPEVIPFLLIMPALLAFMG